ncbi:MAG: endolytic transglycosylase MltG [Paracoccaceae bacterium]
MWRHIASNALSLIILALFVAGGMIVWGRSQYYAQGPLDEAICLRVPAGSTMNGVARDLESRGAIGSATVFRLGADYTDKAQLLKAGSFLVPQGASMEQIVDIVTRGGASTCGTEIVYRIGVNRAHVLVRELDPATDKYVEVVDFDPSAVAEEAPAALPDAYLAFRDEADTRYRVALAEGATSWQVVDALQRADFLTGEIAEIPPEGMLAPDSYEVTPGTDIAALLGRMQASQEARLDAAWRERADDLPYETREEALIMASIIEKETGVPDERRQVASVFVNRLRQGMRLQTDPTVIYGVTNGQGVLGRGLRRSELDRETPYNTYVIAGLPPTPIANPGLAAIEAALNPDDTPYIFFVADGTGGHAFAVTLDEHNANVARWRAIEAQQRENAAE